MDRALLGTAIAFPASLYGFTDLILHNRFLQAPQQGLCVVEEKTHILGRKLVRRTAKSTDIAPLVSPASKAVSTKMLASMVDPTLFRKLTLPRRPPSFAHSRPLFYQPTVLTDVPDGAAIMCDETFGPVAAITPFDTEEEVVARADATEFGLIAYLHSVDPRRIYRMTRALQFGMLAVNRTKVTGAPIPFGGVKQSGLGREGARRGMEEFMEIKYVCRDWA
jgi:acyl-CoA reductase-like NAD-dependent aldehyde dehydrogenase